MVASLEEEKQGGSSDGMVKFRGGFWRVHPALGTPPIATRHFFALT